MLIWELSRQIMGNLTHLNEIIVELLGSVLVEGLSLEDFQEVLVLLLVELLQEEHH